MTSLPVQPGARGVRRQLALRGWGINRFSVGWPYRKAPGLIDWLKQEGHAFNLYGVRTLEEFLQAVALHPAAVTADFNFPQWGYMAALRP